ncbi:39S ribosomal protein L22, mitochondrial [Lithohypha guttulata]|uniref:39S ribosomal protein L22, mitochondrial n=1 Tax=Lithohypha guttulata TaxID=1690604 RepID=A0AAN7SVF9_9EURO|nr:39S ribosomal protein L22, mitochondrial [Lithohypha guttulata]
MSISSLARPRRPAAIPADLCSTFCALYIAARGLSTTATHRADGGSNNATPNPSHSAPPQTTKRADVGATANAQQQRTAVQNAKSQTPDNLSRPQPIAALKMTPAERAAAATRRARAELAAQQKKTASGMRLGGLARDSVFADDDSPDPEQQRLDPDNITTEYKELTKRSPINMEARLNPNPNARARWMRKMVMRNLRHRGRLTREMRIARTERTHTSRSRFFKTSMKKLAPLARQIAGKSIDEAILQMRFSKKKAAKEVLAHLVQARNEAIVVKGMGLADTNTQMSSEVAKVEFKGANMADLISTAIAEREGKGTRTPLDDSKYAALYTSMDARQVQDATQSEPSTSTGKAHEISNPSNTQPLATQTPLRTLKSSLQPSPTDIYVAQSWINRGKYGMVASPRARGRMDVLRPPHTGISVLLKEEKTRTREQTEKETKAIRKRMKGNVWSQLPDRPVTRQSQYVLW